MSFLAHNIDIEYNGKKYHLDSADVLFGNKKELRGLPDTWVKKIGSIGSVDYDYTFKSIELFVVTRDSSSVYEDTMLAVIKPNPRGRGGNKYNLAVINGKEFLSQLLKNLQVSDSRKIKDANDTPDVLDGVLFVAFEDGTEDDMIAEVNKHANESDTIDGVQYETYETDSDDGVAMIDLCAATGDANAFVKALLKKWGIAENVADLEFEASDEMREAVNDSRKQVRDNVDDDYEPPFVVYENGMFAERFDTEKEAVEYAKHLDFKYEHETEIFVVDESGGVVDDIVWSSEWVSDSRVNDMTKPIHLRGYAEKMRAKRRNKNVDDEPNTDEEKPNVSDSKTIKNNKTTKRVKDNALLSFDINGFTGEPAVSGDYYKLTYGRETIYQDSANEDCYNEDSAYAFFEELLNGIGKQGQLAIQAAIDNGFTVSGTDSIETVWQDACDYIIDNTEHVMEYCELVTNNRGQHYDFGEYWEDGEIFDFGWHYKESDHVLFRREGNDFVWVNWFDVPMDGEPDRADYGFVFDTIVYDGEAIDLYDMFV